MNIEQEARGLSGVIAELCDRMDEASPGVDRANAKCALGVFVRENVTAIIVAIEAHDETQAAFDAYRREVSDMAKAVIAREVSFIKFRKYIIPEPVDPLDIMFNQLGVSRPDFDAALAKIGGQIVFGEV